MPRVWAPLVLLPTWLVMVACSPHSLRIGKRCPCGTLGAAQPWAMPLLHPGVCQAHLTLHCPPEFGWGRGGSVGSQQMKVELNVESGSHFRWVSRAFIFYGYKIILTFFFINL